jgi:protein-tyrosine phosphatase
MTAPSPGPGIRTWARRLRHLPDRWLQALRRRQALSAVRALGTVRGILVLCHGNICRSPYAEVVLRGKLAQAGMDGVLVGSAGFIGPDRPPPEAALEAARRRGYELRAHRSRLVTAEAVAAADLVLVMNRAQLRLRPWLGANAPLVLLLGDFDPEPIATRAIRDPVDGPPELFEEVYNRLERCLGAVVDGLTTAASR